METGKPDQTIKERLYRSPDKRHNVQEGRMGEKSKQPKEPKKKATKTLMEKRKDKQAKKAGKNSSED